MSQRLRPPHHWERQIAKYDRKLAAAKTPTQRNYARQMKQAAEKSLVASRNGLETIEADNVVDLDPTQYRDL